jgi:hypothetical protein
MKGKLFLGGESLELSLQDRKALSLGGKEMNEAWNCDRERVKKSELVI